MSYRVVRVFDICLFYMVDKKIEMVMVWNEDLFLKDSQEVFKDSGEQVLDYMYIGF